MFDELTNLIYQISITLSVYFVFIKYISNIHCSIFNFEPLVFYRSYSITKWYFLKTKEYPDVKLIKLPYFNKSILAYPEDSLSLEMLELEKTIDMIRVETSNVDMASIVRDSLSVQKNLCAHRLNEFNVGRHLIEIHKNSMKSVFSHNKLEVISKTNRETPSIEIFLNGTTFADITSILEAHGYLISKRWAKTAKVLGYFIHSIQKLGFYDHPEFGNKSLQADIFKDAFNFKRTTKQVADHIQCKGEEQEKYLDTFKKMFGSFLEEE